MNIQQLFGDFPINRFIADHLHRLPLALPDVCHDLSPLGSWATLGKIIGADDADIMVARQGVRYDGQTPNDIKGAQSLCGEGCTLLIRRAELHDEKIAELANVFARTFAAPVDVHMYATPPGNFGFSWHYDAEDVFILQTTGEKEYLLRKNTVHPWPLEETLTNDMHYEREIMPLMRVVLRAGDMLYIPCGYWHMGRTAADSEVAFSLAVGVMSRSAMDIYEMLRADLLHSLVWRQRLPVPVSGTDEASGRAVYGRILEQLANESARILRSPEFLDRVLDQFGQPVQ